MPRRRASAVGLLNALRSITDTAMPSAPRCDRPPHRLDHLAHVAARRAGPLIGRAVVPARVLDPEAGRNEERIRRRMVDEDEAPAGMGLHESGSGAAAAASAPTARYPDRGGGGPERLEQLRPVEARVFGPCHDGDRCSEPHRRGEERRREREEDPRLDRLERPELIRRLEGEGAAPAEREQVFLRVDPRLLRVQDGQVLARRGDVAADCIDERVAQDPVARVGAAGPGLPSFRAPATRSAAGGTSPLRAERRRTQPASATSPPGCAVARRRRARRERARTRRRQARRGPGSRSRSGSSGPRDRRTAAATTSRSRSGPARSASPPARAATSSRAASAAASRIASRRSDACRARARERGAERRRTCPTSAGSRIR